MKKNGLAVIALVVAIIFTSFKTFEKGEEFRLHPDGAASRYAVYDGSDAENSASNYPAFASMPTSPSGISCPSGSNLCYFRIDDEDNDNDIQNDDFEKSFEDLDSGAPGNGLLSDEDEISNQLKKRN